MGLWACSWVTGSKCGSAGLASEAVRRTQDGTCSVAHCDIPHSVWKLQPESHAWGSVSALGDFWEGWCNVYLCHLCLAGVVWQQWGRTSRPPVPWASCSQNTRWDSIATVLHEISLVRKVCTGRGCMRKTQPGCPGVMPVQLSGLVGSACSVNISREVAQMLGHSIWPSSGLSLAPWEITGS